MAERLFVPSPKPKHFFRLPGSRRMTSWVVPSAHPSHIQTACGRLEACQSLSLLLRTPCKYVHLCPALFVARVSLFPWRHPAALNGGRVVYLNGYWVAWLAASCPTGRKLSRVGQKKGYGVRKTNVDSGGSDRLRRIRRSNVGFRPFWARSFLLLFLKIL